MKNVAILLRALQLYAHEAHNKHCGGCNFLQNHEFLGELYAAFESDYDSVVERIIGLTGDCDIDSITESAAEIACKAKTGDALTAFAVLMATENNLRDLCTKENKSATLGTQNLLQGIADKSEMRHYKYQQLLKARDE